MVGAASAANAARTFLGIPEPERQAGKAASITSNFSEADTFVEQDPSSVQWVRSQLPTAVGARAFVANLFPFTRWITHYNVQWLIGDLVAGITIGAVVVPQGMAYAKLLGFLPRLHGDHPANLAEHCRKNRALLPVQYGLYSSFCGVMFYWLFATSKDITIGPVAVMSKLTGDIIENVQAAHPEFAGAAFAPVIASSLALIAGCIVFALGLIRLGWIVDFIPLVSIAAFMTGSAINIAAGQVPTVFGIQKLFDTRAPTYLVIINTLKHLHQSKLDAALGLTALAMLYLIRSACNYGARRFPQRKRSFFFAATLRTVFVILLYTMISWLMERHHRAKPTISILGQVPRGFTAMGAPRVDATIVSAFADQLPVAVIVLLIEHIAISKSFGRVNNYRIDPSQELVAIGFTNIFAPFFGGYPATGSFSRTAIKSKAGVRTPLAGVITGIVVVLALYALPAVFFYIPNSALSAVIIHAVGDLITPPKTVYNFWRVNPLEVVIFFAGVLVTVFTSIENGIYVTVAVSGGLMLWRIAKPAGDFLGSIRVVTVRGGQERTLLRPINHSAYASNPSVPIDQPHPGVFIFRFNSDFIYPNVNSYADMLTNYILDKTRPTSTNHYERLGDRPWNDPVPRANESNFDLPTLKAIVFDMSAVSNVDVTSVQLFVDLKKQFARHSSPDPCYIHFAGIRSAWTRRALASAGFGTVEGETKAVFSVAAGQGRINNEAPDAKDDAESKLLPVQSVDRPAFNADVEEALIAIKINLGVLRDDRALSPRKSDEIESSPAAGSTPEKRVY